MVQGQVFLKWDGGIDTFSIYFFQGLLVLYLEITVPFAKLCLEKLFTNYELIYYIW